MPVIPLLPRLKDDDSTSIVITKAAEWTSNSQTALPNLIKSLKVATDNDSRISSIPDVWARPILYKEILSNAAHPLHDMYVKEWRGILAILALRKVLGLDMLKVVSIDVPYADKLESRDPEFLKVISKSLPTEYKREENPTAKDGYKIDVLLCKDTPIAFSWPGIFLCPAVELDDFKKVERTISWWTGNGLGDPISVLNDANKQLLRLWVQKVKSEVGDSPETIDLLQAFVEDIEAALPTRGGEEPAIELTDPLPLTGASAPVARAVNVGCTTDFISNSNILLDSNRPTAKKKILVLSKEIEQQWNKAASDIIVGSHVTVESILNRITGYLPSRTKILDYDLTSWNAEIWYATEFFTDALAIVPVEEDMLSNSLVTTCREFEGTRYNIVPPIKKELLNYLSPEYIAENLEITVSGSEIIVRLRLPVTGDGKNTKIEGVKHYKRVTSEEMDSDTGIILEYGEFPITQVWPNLTFTEEDIWKAYFALYIPGTKTSFVTEPIWDNPENKREVPSENGLKTYIYRGKSFPEAFSCMEPIEDAYGRRFNDLPSSWKEPFEVGIILVRKPKPSNVGNNTTAKWKIGIDFGTTNTVIYYSINGENPRVLSLPNRMFNVFWSPNRDVDVFSLDQLRTYFMPVSTQPANDSVSIKSMFRCYAGTAEGREDDIFFRGNVYYVDEFDNVKGSKLEGVYTDEMKWSRAGKGARRSFLSQLFMQCMFEAIANKAQSVELLYSYPVSMTRKERDDLKKLWRSIISNELADISSISIEANSIKSSTESACVAQYFVERMNATINSGIICLDIGGGSTDIAVWKGRDNEIQQQTSLRFAGNNIMGDYFYNKYRRGQYILDDFTESDKSFRSAIDDIKDSVSSGEKEFKIKVESFLKYFDKKVVNGLYMDGSSQSFTRAQRDLSFAVAGILYYTGIVLGLLYKDKFEKELTVFPHCYIGGNASKILHWTDNGQFESDGMIAALYRDCFIAGIKEKLPEVDTKKPLTIVCTDDPKAEVAYGLVAGNVESIQYSSEDAGEDLYVAGEVYYVEEGSPLNPDYITQDELLKKVYISDINPEVFKRFVDVFNKAARNNEVELVNFDESDYVTICSKTNQVLADDIRGKSEADSDIVVEPIFIMILKEAFMHLAQKK